MRESVVNAIWVIMDLKVTARQEALAYEVGWMRLDLELWRDV